MAVENPPAYAWDWLARQRVAWREIRTRLVTAERDARARPPGDVPDWSADHPDLVRSSRLDPSATNGDRSDHDYRDIDTRAEVIAALRQDYARDVELRRTVDAVVAEVAFLGRLDVPLHELGVRSAPRGMRWWWDHLGGPGPGEDRSGSGTRDEHAAMVPMQLRLVDVLAGYGDVPDV